MWCTTRHNTPSNTFSYYVNDLPHASDLFFSVLFADDTNAFVPGNNLQELTTTVNIELDKLKYMA